jgi:hypothetical protein
MLSPLYLFIIKNILPEIAVKYEALIVNFPNLTLANIDRDVARRAAQLKA